MTKVNRMHPLGIMTVYTKLHDNPTSSCSVISTTKQKDFAIPRAVQLVWQEPSFILLQLLNLQMGIYDHNTVIKVSCFLIIKKTQKKRFMAFGKSA